MHSCGFRISAIRVGGKALDAELAHLVPQAGLSSAQTDGVIPFRDRCLPACSLAAEIRNPQEHTGPRRRVTARVLLGLLLLFWLMTSFPIFVQNIIQYFGIFHFSIFLMHGSRYFGRLCENIELLIVNDWRTQVL